MQLRRGMVLEGHHSAIRGFSFLPDGTMAVSTSWRDEVKIWNLADGRHGIGYLNGNLKWSAQM